MSLRGGAKRRRSDDEAISHFPGAVKLKRRHIMRRMFGFLIGIAVGGLVGGSIALLLAPEAGEELRGQLRERGQNFFNDVRHAADERRIELRQRLETMRAPREEV
jgi:hypothetical protein